MPRLISLESLDTPPVQIIQIDGGSLTIGREPENHVVVDSEAVSRQHGCLIEAEGHWVFKDFESTNGSWINGIKLTPGQIRLLRNNDVIQLADFPVRVKDHESGNGGAHACSILVFYNDSFESEFPLSAGHDRFVVGGPNADYSLEGTSNAEPQLEVLYMGTRLELTAGVSAKPIIVNGMAVGGVAALSDRDEIMVGPYRFVVNDLRTAVQTQYNAQKLQGNSPAFSANTGMSDGTGGSGIVRTQEEDWESEASRRKSLSGRKFVFGSEREKEVTSTIGFGDFGQTSPGFEMSASHRFSQAVAEAEEGSRSRVSEHVMMLFGIVVFCVIVGFLAFFFLSMS